MSNYEEKIRDGYVYDLPQIVFSEEEFRGTVQEGGRLTAVVHMHASDGSIIQGTVMSDDPRIIPGKSQFEGKECEFSFSVDVKGLRVGKTLESGVLIRSNLSEVVFPITVEITELVEEDGEPSVRKLDDFLKLCQKNLREGFRVFTNPGFAGILNGKNRQYLALYKGMSQNPVTYQHLEEFLVSTGKKEPIEISLDRQEKAVYHLDVSQKDTLYVYKNNWGYVRLEVEVEGDFLEVEKKVITTDDFIGKVYGLEYIVHSDKLGEGRTFGKIRIRSVHQTIEYVIEASRREESQILPTAVRNRRISWLLRDFLNLQLHTLDYPGWQESSSMTVYEMLEEDPSDIWALLYQAYLEYTRENLSKVMEILWPIKDGSLKCRNEEQRGVYLTLAKAVNLLPEEKNDIIPILQRYYLRRPDSYLLLKLLHQEMPESNRSVDRMQEYEECYQAGCNSPFLFLDAWNLLSKEESLLRRLSPFMIRVLRFGQKRGTLTEGLLQRTAFLSNNYKHYQNALFRILSAGYELYPNDDILEAICKMLIKGDPIRPECFVWYERAVARDIRVTRLYEYYMETYTKSADEEIPMQIRMYFATNTSLREKKKALLYASIVRHKDMDETSYINYARNMRSFAYDALKRKKIDPNYAILYTEFFAKPDSAETARLMSEVIFAQKVIVKNPAIRRVIVTHNAMKTEESCALSDGVAYPRIYSDEACILLEDVNHRRFATTIPYEKEKLFEEKPIARECMEFGILHPGVELSVCHEKAFRMEINAGNVQAYRSAVRDEAFTDLYRNTIRRKLLDYELEHEEESLPDALPNSEIHAYAQADKVGTVMLLIRNCRYEDAAAVVAEFGYEGIRIPLLVKLAHRLILDYPDAIDEHVLTCLAWYVFNSGKYDEVILDYLRENYEGSVRNLCLLWQKLNGFQMDSMKVAEKILLTSIETHQFPENETELLRLYVRQRGRTKVINAYLAYVAEYYFLSDRPTAGQMFILMEGALQREEMHYSVCKLALLKYYAEIGALNHTRMELCRRFLREMDIRGYRFEFYNYLPKELTQAYQIEDKVFVQEHYRPESRVVIHYQLTEADGEIGEWVSEPMRNVYQGIFVKEFLLFYGESLTYYLTVTENGHTENTDSYQVSLVDMDTSGSTRYKLLNRMLESRDNKDIQTLNQTVNQYLTQEAFVDQFLKLM